MRGWLYVMTNPAMPGIVKIGYSAKDPELRAEELNQTGIPHKPIVEYDLLIEEPYLIEQKVHSELQQVNEGKEWFRCSIEDAILAIQHAANGKGIVETYKHADREKVLELLELEKEAQRQHEQLQKEESERKSEIEREKESYSVVEEAYFDKLEALNQSYKQQLSGIYEDKRHPLMLYWFGAIVSITLLIFVINGVEENLAGSLVLISIFGLILLYPVRLTRRLLENRFKSSSEYMKLGAERSLRKERLTAEFAEWKKSNLKYYKPKSPII